MAVAAVAAAEAMEHYYNKNIIHITKKNYYAQTQAGLHTPIPSTPPKKKKNI
jgi:RAB protein geranylgeranyltransferase component A